MDLNKAMIIGRLTKDPEARVTTQGQNISSFSVATNMVWTDQSGQRQEKTEFHNIVAWRKLAEICNQYLKKAKRVYIEGRIQTRSWQDQNGTTKYRTEIVADNVIMLDGPSGGATTPNMQNETAFEQIKNANPVPQATAPTATQPQEEEVKIEDIPF